MIAYLVGGLGVIYYVAIYCRLEGRRMYIIHDTRSPTYYCRDEKLEVESRRKLYQNFNNGDFFIRIGEITGIYIL